MKEMKTVKPGRSRIVHVETELGIVNIYVGLRDMEGRRVETITLIPNDYSGEPKVRVEGGLSAASVRFVEEAAS